VEAKDGAPPTPNQRLTRCFRGLGRSIKWRREESGSKMWRAVAARHPYEINMKFAVLFRNAMGAKFGIWREIERKQKRPSQQPPDGSMSWRSQTGSNCGASLLARFTKIGQNSLLQRFSIWNGSS